MPPRTLMQLSASELARMTDVQAASIISAVDSQNQRQFVYAQIGMLCATLCFLSIVGAFVYLIVLGHDRAAASVLGTGVLAIVAQMLKIRLDKGS